MNWVDSESFVDFRLTDWKPLYSDTVFCWRFDTVSKSSGETAVSGPTARIRHAMTRAFATAVATVVNTCNRTHTFVCKYKRRRGVQTHTITYVCSWGGGDEATAGWVWDLRTSRITRSTRNFHPKRLRFMSVVHTHAYVSRFSGKNALERTAKPCTL